MPCHFARHGSARRNTEYASGSRGHFADLTTAAFRSFAPARNVNMGDEGHWR